MIHKLELLSPAKNLESGCAAINYGADAVYIGPENFGARAAVGNSIEDISKLCDFAHLFNAKVYATINTIFDDSEISKVQSIIDNLSLAKIDALIIQDLGIFELETHKLPIFASTQTHNYDLIRIKFLENLGIERFILARELSLDKIREIRQAIDSEIEVFIYGALCVSYSGQCYASFASTGRSANRGECSQICRHKFNLLDNSGNSIQSEQHFLSLKDLNLEKYIADLIEIGVSSFKIEGRLKDLNYVKNATAYFRQLIDKTIADNPNFQRSSSGKTDFQFVPDLNRTFNRGFTDYFIEKRETKIASFATPKHIGEKIGKISQIGKNYLTIISGIQLKNGDGLTFFNQKGELEGFLVNSTEQNRIVPNKMPNLEVGTEIFRNNDVAFEAILENDKSKRRISVTIEVEINLDIIIYRAKDEDGNISEFRIDNNFEISSNRELAQKNLRKQFSKSGNTIFEVDNVLIPENDLPFISLSEINNFRTELLNLLLEERKKNFIPARATKERKHSDYFEKSLDFRANVMNSFARKIYEEAGVKSIEDAFEKASKFEGKVVMTTKYCLKYELGICPVHQKEQMSAKEFSERNNPLYLEDKSHRYKLEFDCKFCEMKVIY